MTIAPEQQFGKVIVYLPTSNSPKTPGIELVGCSRAMNPDWAHHTVSWTIDGCW